MSVSSYLQMKRLTHLTFKTWFHRRQRFSTQFFRRYSVKPDEIDIDDLSKRRRMFDTHRVVDEC